MPSNFSIFQLLLYSKSVPIVPIISYFATICLHVAVPADRNCFRECSGLDG